jgi:hypothetical protein
MRARCSLIHEQRSHVRQSDASFASEPVPSLTMVINLPAASAGSKRANAHFSPPIRQRDTRITIHPTNGCERTASAVMALAITTSMIWSRMSGFASGAAEAAASSLQWPSRKAGRPRCP